MAFCLYRISPLGAHIDHQYGKINGLAIDKGIHMAYGNCKTLHRNDEYTRNSFWKI